MPWRLLATAPLAALSNDIAPPIGVVSTRSAMCLLGGTGERDPLLSSVLA